MWWLRRAGYHKMLCFWDLTVVASQAYIPPVGRVAGRARETPERPRRDGRVGVARPWLEAHRPSTRSYDNNRLKRHHETRTSPGSRQPRSWTGVRWVGRRQTGGQPVGCENSTRPPLRAVSSLSWRPVARGTNRSRMAVEATPPPKATSPTGHPTRPRRPIGARSASRPAGRLRRPTDDDAAAQRRQRRRSTQTTPPRPARRTRRDE